MTTRVFIAVLYNLRDKEYLYSDKWLEYNNRITDFKFRY